LTNHWCAHQKNGSFNEKEEERGLWPHYWDGGKKGHRGGLRNNLPLSPDPNRGTDLTKLKKRGRGGQGIPTKKQTGKNHPEKETRETTHFTSSVKEKVSLLKRQKSAANNGNRIHGVKRKGAKKLSGSG